MAYQVLARKSRPQDFSSVVGQSSVVTALRNALAEGRVAQAYLFAGIRGVGKTSVARVFAKALNCERGPGSDPCNECSTCVEITRGSDLDVIEVDAATYSKVEQVRELTESLQYGPANGRYKVVVIDEIHRLSRQAFDALLKIVEEPPERVVFIFATTEIDAVPATILSRCQEFRFRRVAFGELSAHLRRLCESESIEASDASLRLVARAAEGSVRDAVALLDQLATFGSGKIEDEDAARLIGGLDADFYEGLLRAIVDGDSTAIVAAVARLENEGWDPRTAYAQLLTYLRDALHLAVGADLAEVDLPQEQAAALGEVAQGAGRENLLRILHLLLGSEMTVRRSESGALAAEVSWLRAAELPKLTRIEEILSGGGGGGTQRADDTGRGAAKPKARRAAPNAAPRSEPRAAPANDPDHGAPAEGSAAAARRAAEAVARGAQEREKPNRGKPDSALEGTAASPDPAATRAKAAPANAKRPEAPPKPETTPLPQARPEQPQTEPQTEPQPQSARAAPPEPEAVPDPGPAAEAPAGESRPAGAPPADAAEEVERATDTAAAPSNGNGAASGGGTGRLLEELGRRKQFLAGHLAEADSLRMTDGRLEISVPDDDRWLHDSLQRDGNRNALEESIAAVWGDGVTWSLVSSGRVSVTPESRSASSETPTDIMSDPEVQTVLELFGGTVETAESIEEEEEA